MPDVFIGEMFGKGTPVLVECESMECPECDLRTRQRIVAYEDVEFHYCYRGEHSTVWKPGGKERLTLEQVLQRPKDTSTDDNKRNVDYVPQKEMWENQRRKRNGKYNFYVTSASGFDRRHETGLR